MIIGGQDVTTLPPQKRDIGFVFQHYAAFKHMTVRDNVAFGLKIRKQPKDKVRARVDELLEIVGLTGWADRYPAQLSGGQRQRMALARALAVEPAVLLLDEPFGALDANVREELREWLRRLHDEVHVTTVIVTHDQEEAMAISDRIVVLDHGRVQQVGRAARGLRAAGQRVRHGLPRTGVDGSARRSCARTTWCCRPMPVRRRRRGAGHPRRLPRLRGARRARPGAAASRCRCSSRAPRPTSSSSRAGDITYVRPTTEPAAFSA